MNRSNFLKAVFLVSTTAMFGSLFFSNVMQFPPCTLCWYQRVALFPLVIISAVGLWTDETNPVRYVLPFAALGLVVAGYHNLLYYGFVSEGLVPCTKDLSCTAQQLNLFGFVTIPLLSLTAFAALLLISLAHLRSSQYAEK